MAADDDKRGKSDRRGVDRRMADDPGYTGPERRKTERRTGKDRRSEERRDT